MWQDLFRQPIVINEEAFIEHYQKCLNNVFNRILTCVAASGLPPEEFLANNTKMIVSEIQAVKDNFMAMLSFPDETYTDEFGIKLSKILLNKLHNFTHHSLKKEVLAGYN